MEVDIDRDGMLRDFGDIIAVNNVDLAVPDNADSLAAFLGCLRDPEGSV